MAKRQRETMALAFAIQDSNPEEGVFKGMASVFNTMIDTWVPTRIKPGAFTKTLSDGMQAGRVKVLYQHNPNWPIGVPVRMEENGDGLYVEGRISQTTQGKDVLTLLRDKVITEMSIGFDTIRFEMVDEGAMGQVRHITEIRLWEFSLVTFGANQDAKINSVHSLYQALRMSEDMTLTPEMHTFLRSTFDRLRAVEDAGPTHLLAEATHILTEQFAGKVLSAKNMQLVKDCKGEMQKCDDMLQQLLDAAEPKDDESRSLTASVDKRLRDLDLSWLGASAPRASAR